MSESSRVLVVGSLNEDLRLRTEQVPAAGETVLGGPHDWGLGGKGSNQAIAAARYGADVAMIGRLGDDAGGAKVRAAFADEGIDASMLGTSEDAGTGLALIILEPSGENRIIVSSGANMQVSLADLASPAATAELESAAVVLAQLEIPIETVQAAFVAAGGTTVLNAAPGRELPAGLLAETDVLVVNEIELAMTAGLDRVPDELDPIVAACRSVSGPGAVIVTRGAAGAVLVNGDHIVDLPAPKVDAIDTTGAGDCFCGVLAASLAEGVDLADAAAVAVRAASLAASRPGAAEGMPRRDEIDATA